MHCKAVKVDDDEEKEGVYGRGDGPVGPQRPSVCLFAGFMPFLPHLFQSRSNWSFQFGALESFESLTAFSGINIIGMWPCNVAFVCQKIFECNDDCLCWQSKANGLGRQSFVSWVELIIFDGLLFVDSCQGLMMGATSIFNRKDGHGCHILLPLHPGRQTGK